MKHELNPAGWLPLYGDYLFSLAMLQTRNQQLAEDLVQDTFLAAIKAKESFRGESTEKTWLTTILKNKISDHYRKKDVLKELDDYLAATEQSFHRSFFSEAKEDYGHWTMSAAPKDWMSKGADSKVMAIDFKRILQYCLEKMPAKLIPVFLARFINEEESATICKEFNITASNYWVIVHRAKVLMRSCLEKNWINQ